MLSVACFDDVARKGKVYRQTHSIVDYSFADHAISASDVRQFLERIKYLQARPSKNFVMARHHRQIVTAGHRGEVAVFDRHELTGSFELKLLVGPNMRRGHIEGENSALE